jgi:hypothetical protein
VCVTTTVDWRTDITAAAISLFGTADVRQLTEAVACLGSASVARLGPAEGRVPKMVTGTGNQAAVTLASPNYLL